MLPCLARFLVIPLHERLLGRRTLAEARRLDDAQWWSPSRVRAHQRQLLRRLLIHAYDRVPFYHERMIAAGVDPRQGEPMDALRALPFLTKDDIRTKRERMIWGGGGGGLHALNTGGSTGQPLTFLVDRQRQACDQAARFHTHRWFGVRPGDRELWLWGSPIEHDRADRIKRQRDRLFNHRLLNAFNMSLATMDAYLDEIERFRPSCIFGYPSSIHHLVEHALRRGRVIARPAVKAVFVTGEVCYPHQREAIRDFFGVPVVDGYGSRDGGFIAHECELGAMHIISEHVLVEVFNQDGPAPTGTSGEIILTHLRSFGMPFIRYRTSDRARLRPGRCACGRGWPMLEAIEGRQTDFIYLPDGSSMHALSLIYVMRGQAGIRRFRVTQQADHALDVEIVPATPERRPVPRWNGRGHGNAGAGSADLVRQVTTGLRKTTHGAVPVSVRFVDDISCADSGKYHHVVSHVPGAVRAPEPRAPQTTPTGELVLP